ncbi:ATP-binding protein [Vibrio sp. Of7-15]|uniref:ATP-binding protein n=1 Tax=Vibrio sp. Of7-15 TaxID=2724879 RepID=UPI001EF22AEA|nr:ATP-binding protein [Vibrio sp. Of7-15]MCG7495704.1 ATP-binding protein [Vibrio sp. Of7-15]
MNISTKIIAPFFLLFSALVVALWIGIHYLADSLIERKVTNRALELTDTFLLAAVDNKTSEIIKVVSSIGANEDVSHIVLLSRRTNMVVASNLGRYRNKHVSFIDIAPLRRFMLKSSNDTGIHRLSYENNVLYFSYHTHLPDNASRSLVPYTLFLTINTNEISRSMEKLSHEVFLVMCFSVLIILGFCYGLIRFIVLKPIKNITASFTDTNLNVEPKAYITKSKDEIAQLGFALSEQAKTQYQQHKELQASSRAIKSATQAKSEFLATMTHEIRTPLNGVIGIGSLLKQTELSKEQSEYVHSLVTSGEQLLLIVNDILDFSKIEAGKLELECESFSVRLMFEQCKLMFSNQMIAKGLEFVVDCQEGKTPSLIGDAARLKQVIVNLLSNAYKFTEYGHIKLSMKVILLTEKDAEFQIVIEDTGIGMSKEQQTQLFKQFVQLDSSSTRKTAGTGLGLAICKSLVEAMKGSIDVSSEVGVGTRFRVCVRMPVAEQEVGCKSSVHRYVTPQLSVLKPLRVLVVDDTPLNLKILNAMLSKMGHEVVLAENGQVAFELFTEQSFDLVFLDCLMPVLDGYETAKKIREWESSECFCPIVAVTASALQETKDKCHDAGMNDFITKPLKVDEITRALEKWQGKARFKQVAQSELKSEL